MNKKLGFGIVIFCALCLFGGALIFANSETLPGTELVSGKIGALPKLSNQDIQPHKALYDIKMISSSNGSQIINISGTMYFEWKPTCEAWTTDHRFNLTYEYADSPAMRVTSDFSTWESLDGKLFNFSSRRSRDGDLYEEIRGQAERFEDGTGKATYTMPEGLEFDLPIGFVFPMQHTLDVIAAMKQPNAPFLNRTLFDGSDIEGPIEVNAFIGKPANAIARIDNVPKIDLGLLNGKARDVQMAFFPLLDNEVFASDYEMNALFHENSVISDMVIDYNEFSISQKLTALERVEKPLKCQ